MLLKIQFYGFMISGPSNVQPILTQEERIQKMKQIRAQHIRAQQMQNRAAQGVGFEQGNRMPDVRSQQVAIEQNSSVGPQQQMIGPHQMAGPQQMGGPQQMVGPQQLAGPQQMMPQQMTAFNIVSEIIIFSKILATEFKAHITVNIILFLLTGRYKLIVAFFFFSFKI